MITSTSLQHTRTFSSSTFVTYDNFDIDG